MFWQTPPIANRFHFRPGIDGGFGNDLRLATINIDFIARFPLGASGWELVQGGGPVIVLTKFDGFDGTDTSAGGSYIFGFAHRSGFFGEFRIGGGNTPSLKMGAGYGIEVLNARRYSARIASMGSTTRPAAPGRSPPQHARTSVDQRSRRRRRADRPA